jgi:hypothetical protein
MDTYVKGTVAGGFVAFLSWILVVNLARSEDVNIALMLPVTGSWPVGKRMASAATMALDAINSDKYLLPNRTLKFLWNNTDCNARKGLGEVVNLWASMRTKLHAFVGPGCDGICESSGMLAAEWNVPMISWGCASIHLSNKDFYPTFARTVGPYTKVSKMFRRILEYYNWTRCAVAASTQGFWQLTAHGIKGYLEESGFTVAEFHSFDPGHEHVTGREKGNHLKMLQDLRTKARSKYSLRNY